MSTDGGTFSGNKWKQLANWSGYGLVVQAGCVGVSEAGTGAIRGPELVLVFLVLGVGELFRAVVGDGDDVAGDR